VITLEEWAPSKHVSSAAMDNILSGAFQVIHIFALPSHVVTAAR